MTEVKRENFFIVDNDIFSFGLKPRDIVVYCYLCRRMNRSTGVAFPSRSDIAKNCGIGKKETVDKAIKSLIGCGLIEKYHQYSPTGDYSSNIYRIKKRTTLVSLRT